MNELSVIVPCYNVEEYLERCIDSLVHQDIEVNAYEVLLIDDGSTDKTGDICDRYATRYPQVQVIHQSNAGQGAARNVGLDHAKGKYIFFVDGDDFVAENCFAHLLRLADNNNLDVLAFDSLDVEEHAPVPTISGETTQAVNVQTGAAYISQNTMRGPVWWYIAKRDMIEREQLRFPEGHFLEDSPFTPDVLLSAQRMAKISKVCYYYVQRSSSTMHSKRDKHRLSILGDYIFSYTSVDEVIAKHRTKIDASAYLRLCARRDSFLYFGIVRALNAGVAKEFYANLRKRHLLPLRTLDKRDFAGAKWTVLRLMLNCPRLTCFLGLIIGYLNRKQ